MVCRGVIFVLFEIKPSFEFDLEFLLAIIPDIGFSLWAEGLQKSEQNVSLNLLLKTPQIMTFTELLIMAKIRAVECRYCLFTSVNIALLFRMQYIVQNELQTVKTTTIVMDIFVNLLSWFLFLDATPDNTLLASALIFLN